MKTPKQDESKPPGMELLIMWRENVLSCGVEVTLKGALPVNLEDGRGRELVSEGQSCSEGQGPDEHFCYTEHSCSTEALGM